MRRLEEIIGSLPEDAGAAIVTGPYSRRYLTGLNSSAGTLVLTRGGAKLIIDSRYHELAVKTVRGCEVILQADNLYEQIRGLLSVCGAKSVLLESAAFTLKARNTLRENLADIALLEDNRLSESLSRLRECKSEAELDKIRAAQRIADATFGHLLKIIKPGVSEREIALEAETFGKQAGADDVAFPLIVAAGASSSLPHAAPGENKVRGGDTVLIDMGFKVGGYCSDMTRTVVIGKAGTEQRAVYDTVLRAQQAAFEKIQRCAICKDVDAAARELIDASPYKGLFGHGLGHSLGMEVHEPPGFNKTSGAKLSEGMVLTVEPGIYLPGQFGVRIEDLIVVTDDGYENLTRAPKHLIEL